MNDEVNVINLVDVVLVLLIIFMVTAPMLQGGIKINLPRAVARPMDLDKAMILSISPDGGVAIGDGEAMPFDRFKSQFQILLETRKPQSIAVRGDRAAMFDYVARVLDLVAASGVKTVGIETQPGGSTVRP